MSMSKGTGTPHFFKCPVQRREDNDNYFWAKRGRRENLTHNPHQIQRTGRTKPSTNNRSARMLTVSHEYVCSCGHRGWSAHKGVLNRPLMEDGAS